MLQLSSVSKWYGKQKAIDQLSFSAKPGEIVGLLGPNGAGKSTVMKLITGYLSPSEGNIFVCGTDTQLSPLKTKQKVGYLPEQNPLYADMYVKEYLGFMGKLHGVKNLKPRIGEMISLCGLTAEQHKLIGALSKGYRQRVGLAQALLHNPEALILDEPTSGLDPNQIIEIRKVIKNISTHKTVLFSSHIMQ
ncbi:MAG: gliding motility-associated ABC transporter ATP-binding subunit GldA, partial [Candidatus Nephrothrix sp. EaCA]